MKARLGNPEGVTATAHKLARILFALITTGASYDKSIAAQMSQSNRKKRIRNLKRQATKL
jgi:hypothetical protein